MHKNSKSFRGAMTLVLAILTVMVLVPLTGTSVYAAGNGKNTQSGTGGIDGYISYNNILYNYVYFGSIDLTDDATDNPTAILWRVLSVNGSGGTYSDGTNSVDSTKAMFLLSENVLSPLMAFNSTGTAWSGSEAQTWCRSFYTNDLSAPEQRAVLQTTKTNDVSGGYQNAPLNNDKAFLLSVSEASNAAYGFNYNIDRVAKYNGVKEAYWLRSPLVDNTGLNNFMAFSDGYIGSLNADIINGAGARPALNINKDSILLSSAATGGKTSGSTGAAALTEVSDTGTKDWKLTLKDSGRSFAVGTVSMSGRTLSVNYSGAKTGTNEYISAVIKDSSGNVTYYGKLAAAAAAAGTVAVTLPTGYDSSSDTLYLFSEQNNGDYKTDYASELQAVTLPDASVTPASADFDKYVPEDVTITKTDNGHTLESIKNNGTALTSGTDYTVSGDTVTISKNYLSGLACGTQTLTFDYNSGTDPTAAITISDSAQASITPTRATFDRYAPADVTVTKNDGMHTLTGIRHDGTSLVNGRDYSVSGDTVTISKEYLFDISEGEDSLTLTFNYDAGTVPILYIAITDSTPVSGKITPDTASFDKNAPGDISVSVDNGTYSLRAIKNGTYTLVKGTDYVLTDNGAIISKKYLSKLAAGKQVLTFDYDGGTDPTLTVTVTDTAKPGSPAGKNGVSGPSTGDTGGPGLWIAWFGLVAAVLTVIVHRRRMTDHNNDLS